MKICKYCNEEYEDDNYQYCPKCGNSLSIKRTSYKYKYFNRNSIGELLVLDDFQYNESENGYVHGYTHYLDLLKVDIDKFMADMKKFDKFKKSILISYLKGSSAYSVIAVLFLKNSEYSDTIVICNLNKLNDTDSKKVWDYLTINNMQFDEALLEEINYVKDFLNSINSLPDDIRLMIEVK